MAVLRVNKNSNYTVMSNYHFREKEMSLKAKGLLSLMLSLPDDWDYSIAGLVAICKENETAINSTLRELKKFGYLVMTKLTPSQTKSGRIEYIYNIYEQPHFKGVEYQQVEKQAKEKQGIENLGVEFLGVGNQVQLSTKELNTKELNNNNKKESKKKPSGYDEIISNNISNNEVIETLQEFIKMRKLIKKPLTDYALKMLINKLKGLSNDPDTQVKILQQSIIHNWQGIFELKEDNQQAKKEVKSSFADVAEHIRNNDDTTEEIDRNNLNF